MTLALGRLDRSGRAGSGSGFSPQNSEISEPFRIQPERGSDEVERRQTLDRRSGPGALGGVSNYLIGNNRKAWHTGIPHYERLRVASVYDGIDLVLYGRGRDLEYDFVVAPGADPKQIRVSFEGAKGMRIDSKTGDLVVTTATGSELRHVRPNVYQQVGSQRVEVAGEYKMMSSGQAGFALAHTIRAALWSSTRRLHSPLS
jgi:hypothetical protein